MNTHVEFTPFSAFVLLATAAILASRCVLVTLHPHGESVSLKFLSPEVQPGLERLENSPPTQPLFPGQPMP